MVYSIIWGISLVNMENINRNIDSESISDSYDSYDSYGSYDSYDSYDSVMIVMIVMIVTMIMIMIVTMMMTTIVTVPIVLAIDKRSELLMIDPIKISLCSKSIVIVS